MVLSRRRWLSMTIAGLSVFTKRAEPSVAAESQASEVARRIARVIHEYEDQGDHRTATHVDQTSADWLSAKVRQAGLAPAHERFSITRIDPVSSALITENRRIEGLPLFDAAFTGQQGVGGPLGELGSDAAIGLTEIVPNSARAGALGEARRMNRHRAIVCVTRGGTPGLCPSNADDFLAPFGPPVLQLSSTEAAWLNDLAQRRATVQLVAQATRTMTTSANVTAALAGADRSLPPLVVMTPRSGWYRCASERGGGIACWLELMRALREGRTRRDVLFVASSGHELGYFGINAFIERRPGVVKDAVGWLHFGANIGAAIEPGNRLQASDDDLDGMLTAEMTASGLRVERRAPRGTVPGGEAGVVHNGGGRYVSIIGNNALFHNPDDRGPSVIDPGVIARYCTAFTLLAKKLAQP
ncbi:MAG TPA: hypothetical protein VNZ26_21455 [Vicinamibacterales bacterium]|nr:hypothetical protein [Vicinamibacterales bacterium]